MANIILLLICLFVGIILQRINSFPKNAYLVLNAFIIYISLPALTLLYTSEIYFQKSQLLPVLMPYILFIASFVFFKIISPLLNFDKSTTGALTITAGISSVSFVGFPIFEFLYGKKGLEMGILMSQSGSFVVCSTLGIMTASYYSASEPSVAKILKNMFTFPPFIAFCVAVILNILGFHFPVSSKFILEKLGSPFTIIALISVGLQITFNKRSLTHKPLLIGLFFKLFLAPLLIFFLYILVVNEKTWLGNLCVIGAGIGSMNTATIIAINHNLNPPLASKMVGIGIPLSLITLIFWYFILSFV